MSEDNAVSAAAAIQDNRSQSQLSITGIEVRNYRLLRHVNVDLAQRATVVVGRNNTGKTTLAEAITSFLDTNAPKLKLADFSVETYADFQQAYSLYQDGKMTDARSALPEISLCLTITYDAALPEYGPLSALIVDLDPDCNQALVRFTYSLQGGRISDLFDGLDSGTGPGTEPDVEAVMAGVATRIPKLFGRTITAIDPNDPSNTRDINAEAIQRLITVHFLKAQRGLDDEKERPKDLIGKIFQTLFAAATQAGDDTAQRATADKLAQAVSGIERELGRNVSAMMKGIVPALEQFGYPGLNNPELEAETTLDIERLLSNYTSIRHRGVAGVSLPESYSGLGSRNLVLMLLTLLGYYREYATRDGMPGLHLIFIEEPEAHLHPQMQEVFIEQLSGIAKLFPTLDTRTHAWAPQFVVSTHSSHVANRAEFSAIRYFRVVAAAEGGEGNHTEVLDLSRAPGIDVQFLHQYLTLTRSDLFFADKAILVEGTTERLMIPAAIRKTAQTLANQYVTLMEVGGAYAHVFFPLLDFLGIPALIVTDIDTVGPAASGSRKQAANVHQGDGTSNATIKKWFSDKEITPSYLLKAADTPEIIQPARYLAYQVPEAGITACGRSFEDAFILANPAIFGLTITGDVDKDEEEAQGIAKLQKKSEFALRFAISEKDWVTPKYIQRGLDWLLAYPDTDGSQVATIDPVEPAVK
ncbi:ATP-dependent nuclease [Mycolicibacterium fortuitum]|uniref:ATP-dependent nuclease n=1 Tax=Mycolicibacterium fortuitum TaxID=1766 RepID=UPI00262852DE|nr:AAA family ATPase [Mycolicibacterium fortuitum]